MYFAGQYVYGAYGLCGGAGMMAASACERIARVTRKGMS